MCFLSASKSHDSILSYIEDKKSYKFCYIVRECHVAPNLSNEVRSNMIQDISILIPFSAVFILAIIILLK